MLIIILLFIVGLALLFCELLLPGAILGITGAFSIVGSIYLAFKNYPDIALWILMLELVAFGISLVIGLKIFPNTPIARRLTLTRTFDAQEGFTSVRADYTQYVGREGIAVTTLRPAGIAMIDGKRLDVVSDGEFIERNSRIKVAQVEGSRIVVHQVTDSTTPSEN
jgi:membrane-bound serine protease (ClpP class)